MYVIVYVHVGINFILSYLILSYLILSYLILSYLILSYLLLRESMWSHSEQAPGFIINGSKKYVSTYNR